MKNLIDREKLEEHVIQRYRFKILGGTHQEPQEELPATAPSEFFENDLNFQPQITNPMDEPLMPPKSDEGQMLFVEELLRKTDELSSNMIKLQMQMEKQEEEFKNRLNEEIAREQEKSFADGFRKAKEESEKSTEEVRSKYIKSIAKLEDTCKKRDAFFEKMQNDIVSTSIEIAKEVIKKEILSSSSKVAIELSKELLKEIKDAQKIELKVNPKDFETLREQYEKESKIVVEADDSVALGGVILLSDAGNLDGTIATRLEKIKNLMQDN
ncbi:MAG: flagellar assembly protein FliH [Sulfurospirillaceae bacterium]|nr:flagellar assembly protein FliH [Sulfurospirillaceae bacterium]MDD3462149.1 flagellar assembly protein FliH [Sulfurospirillaceae bacterium]